MKSRNRLIWLHFFLLILFVQSTNAICPTRFYAQAVTASRAAELDIYFSRAQVETAADCAIFCGKRQFCRSAVYNHDTKSCALSYDKIVECNTQKQRYNTFHLTTDGAESMSIITCVELCEPDKPKFQDSKPSTLFSSNEPSTSIEETNSAARFLSQLKSDTKSNLNGPEHGNGNSGQFVAISRGKTKVNKNGIADPLPPEIIDSDTPSTVIIEALQRLMHEVNKTSKEKPIQSGQLIGRIEAQTQLNTKKGHEFGIEESKKEKDLVNLLGIKSHQKINNKNSNSQAPSPSETQKIVTHTKGIQIIDHRENKKQDLNVKDLITLDPHRPNIENKHVHFHAQPLEIQEIFNGSSNSSSQGHSEVFHSGGAQDSNSGGFFKWLKPGEKFTLPPEVILPPEVAKLVPELLSAVGRSEVGKGLRGTGLTYEITEKDSHPKPVNGSNPDEINKQEQRRTLTRYAKIKVEDDLEKSKEEQEQEKVKEVFNSAASNLDQIVVNGRLLSVDEIKHLMQKELSTSTSTTTPKPWKPASQLFGASEEDDEEDTSTIPTKKSEIPSPNHPHHDPKPSGFLNTFLIQGISSMLHGENDDHRLKSENRLEADEPKINHLKVVETTTSTQPSTTTVPSTTTTQSGPIVCYRQIPQQVLLYANFETLHGISLNECRCRCAETWLNVSDSNADSPRCKSVLYNEITKECSLNQGDHNGKYDLIYDKFIDYHYISCEIKYLLSAARRVCSKILPSIAQNLPTPLRINRPSGEDENTSEPLLRDPKIQTEGHLKELGRNWKTTLSSDRLQATTTLPYLTTQTSHQPTTQTNLLATATQKIPASSGKLEKLPIDETQSNNQLAAVTQKLPILDQDETTVSPLKLKTVKERPLPVFTTTIPQADTTETEDSDLLIQEVTTKGPIRVQETTIPLTTKPLIAIIDSTTSQKDGISVVGEYLTTKLPIKTQTDPMERRITTNLKEKPEIFFSTQTTTPSIISTTTTSYNPLTISGHTEGCFEVIEGYMMQNTAGGLEHDVTMSECQCYCANSLSSKRYAFQCISATYYHNERDCVLNLDNRQLRPDTFMRQLDSAENVTYLGLICPQQKAVQLHAKEGECQSKLSSTTTTTTLKTTTSAVNTDDCFLELPNYVLEGTALAVETNVSVEECKCYCVDAEKRYGTDCQSLEYYYDSQTCLLNKENRISDPDNFNYDAHGLLHSYFDYRCHAEKLTLAVYVDQICSKVIDLKISDVHPTTDNSLDVEDKEDKEEHENEVQLVTQTQPPTGDEEASTQRVKTLKFINESEDDEEASNDNAEDGNKEKGLDEGGEEESDEKAERRRLRKLQKKKRKELKEKEFDANPEAITQESTTPITTVKTSTEPSTTTTQERITTIRLIHRPKNEKSGKRLPEVEELEGEEELKRFEATSTTEAPSTTQTRPTTTTHRPTTTTRRSTTSTTTQATTTTTEKSYLPVGPCRYSALYQTRFDGERLIRRFKVKEASECFAGCHWERCRSANLIQYGGQIKSCELFRDSIVDFRRTNVLEFDRSTVHFDSINCNETPNQSII